MILYEKIVFLKSNYFKEWLDTCEEARNEISNKQGVTCVCGRLATGLHEQTCEKFRKKVTRNAVKRLKHLIPKKQISNKEVETIDLLEKGTLLPPAKDKCQQCAVKHDERQAHDANSLYYQFWFKKQHGRFPTWNDAIEHCSEEVKELWKKQLKAHGVNI